MEIVYMTRKVAALLWFVGIGLNEMRAKDKVFTMLIYHFILQSIYTTTTSLGYNMAILM